MLDIAWLESVELLHPNWLWVWPVMFITFISIRLFAHKYLVAVTDEDLLSASSQQYIRLKHPFAVNIAEHKMESVRQSLFTLIIIWLVLLFLILALSQPVIIGERKPEPPKQRDIIFIIDTSVSMLLRDYVFKKQRIDRMTLLKGLLDDFIGELKADRISVIVFGDSAYTYVPLTSDHNLLRRMLSRIKTTMAGRFSAVGEAIALAVKDANKEPDQKKILVLFTAANQTTGKIAPLAAAALARESNLPVYTVAIGAGSYEAEEKDRLGGLIYHPVDYVLLQNLAEQTSARSYRGSDAAALKQAISDIEQRETNQAIVEPEYYRQSLYQWPLILAMSLVMLISTKRLIRRSRRS